MSSTPPQEGPSGVQGSHESVAELPSESRVTARDSDSEDELDLDYFMKLVDEGISTALRQMMQLPTELVISYTNASFCWSLLEPYPPKPLKFPVRRRREPSPVEESRDFVGELPPELSTMIFRYLHPTDIRNARRVNARWNSLILSDLHQLERLIKHDMSTALRKMVVLPKFISWDSDR